MPELWEDSKGLRLGGKPSPADHRDLTFSQFRDPEVAQITVPPRFGHRGLSERRQPWGMMGNGPDDTVQPGFGGAGDCVLADGVHQTMLWNAEAGRTIKFTGRNAIDAYSAVTGYVIGNPATDQGTNIRQALKWRRAVGIEDAKGQRHKIGAFVALDVGNWAELMEAAFILSGISIGFDCPDYLFQQFYAGQPWSVIPGQHNSIGGHDVPVVGRWSSTQVTCITWAKAQRMTRGFFEANTFEAWGVLSEEMVKDTGLTIDGFDLTALRQKIASYGPVNP